MQAYLVAKKVMFHQDKVNKSKLGYISDQYLKSELFYEKAPSTQKQYQKSADSILSQSIKINKCSSTLRDLYISDITKPLINSIREKRLKAYKARGLKGTVIINRDISYLRTCLKWGLNHIQELPQITNPLDEIEKFKEVGNTRYVTDEEMRIQINEASCIVDYLPLLIRLSYLLGTRGSETIDIKYSNLVDNGIYVSRRKGSKNNTISWSESLKEAVKKSKELNKTRKITAIDPYLLTNTEGGKITQSAVQSAMGRLKKHMTDKNLVDVFFSLHKIKSKAQSDSKNEKISGLSKGMIDHYDTKEHLIDTGLE